MNIQTAIAMVLSDHENMNYTNERLHGMGITSEQVVLLIATDVLEAVGTTEEGNLLFHLTPSALARLRDEADPGGFKLAVEQADTEQGGV